MTIKQYRVSFPPKVREGLERVEFLRGEQVGFLLSVDFDREDYVCTVPLVMIPTGESNRLHVDEDPKLMAALGPFLDTDESYSAVFYHKHPITGPSSPDKQAMIRNYRTNPKLRHTVFVGPEDFRLYTTDGTEVRLNREVYDAVDIRLEDIVAAQQELIIAFQRAYTKAN